MWEKILFGLPRSSIFSSILFIIFIIYSLGSYSNDNTPYVIGENTKEVHEALENSSKELIEWFSNNQMKANAEKCHLLTSPNEESTICIDNDIIINNICGKLRMQKLTKSQTLMLTLLSYAKK